jgi:hypothetical protein
MSKLYKSIGLICFLILSIPFTCQNIGDTINIEMGGSKVLIINKNIEQGWDFEDEDVNLKKRSLGFEFILGSNGWVNWPISKIENSSSYCINYLNSNKVGGDFLLKGISIKSERMYLLPGIGVSWNNYVFKNNVKVESINGNTAITIDTLNTYVKSKLRTTYLQVPLLLGFRFGNINKNPFGVQIGIEGAYQIQAKSTVKSENGNTQTNRRKDNFSLNPYKLSAILRLSIGGFGLFGSFSITPITTYSLDYFPISAGIIIASF